MNNPPSFSLGITQLDAIVEDIPLGFVPATFDEQDPDWAENRSKHRNDPVTMKKLRDKATFKSKKSTSKARQISKCLLMLEIQQDNKDGLHVWVQGEILKFTMLEFAIITDLKCTDNIDDYMYTSSSKSALMSRKLKRTTAELEQCVGTIAEEFGDFSIIPPQKILIKAGFASLYHLTNL
ncbi:hypothetical protein CQW23_08057 [Capsicum baccatum]|uniref:DUF1985 domain-containing protein n=1 Tax=Capsicum baccatum TaxID=33114 RepID=A0A2G2X7W6_CAPBA|nr:hypothetical protein CQW23_08057 [Capsicum baccatum]